MRRTENVIADMETRIAELEDALREATSALQKAGWTNCAERAHGVLEKPNE